MTATVTTNSRKLYRHADLHRVFSPKSIAIIGASPNTASFGTRTIERLQRDYTGRLFPINAKYGEVAGLTCYPSVAELPEPADCVVIALPLEAVEASVM